MESSRTKKPEYTKYEIARIIGARALQISMNAPILLSLSKKELEKINYDPLKIAEIEFKAGILPITVKRPMPKPKEVEEAEEEIEVPVEEKKEKYVEEEIVEELDSEEE